LHKNSHIYLKIINSVIFKQTPSIELLYCSSPVLNLNKMFSSIYLNNISTKVKNSVKRGYSKIQKELKAFTLNIYDNRKFNKHLINTCINISKEYWKSLNSFSTFDVIGQKEFVIKLFQNFSVYNMKILTAENENVIIAFVFIFIHDNECFYWIPGRKSGDYSKYNLGNILIDYMVKYCIDNSITKINFLRGRHKYKYLWNAKDDYTYRIIFNNNSLENLTFPFGESLPGTDADEDHDCKEIQYL